MRDSFVLLATIVDSSFFVPPVMTLSVPAACSTKRRRSLKLPHLLSKLTNIFTLSFMKLIASVISLN